MAGMLHSVLDWFAGLPPALLYLALAFAAGIENVFPPLPSDTVVAFGSFIAARGQASAIGSFAATLAGNLAGAMLMYWVGRRYGAERVLRRFGSSGEARAKLEALYGRYGIWAIAISRFLPGVRAIVPPFAGALRVGAIRAGLAMGLASAIWYGAITYFAFTAGANFEALQARIAEGQKWLAIVAAAIVALALGVWWLRRRRPAH
jgi:membrane protein DedA with SNARE-associated domain